MKRLTIALAVIAAFAASPAAADPIAVMTRDGVTVTLTDEPCAVPGVSSMSQRATWVDSKRAYEGCFTTFPESVTVGAYFDDQSVAVFPAELFAPAQGL